MSDELRVTSDESETVADILRRMEGWAARFRVDLEPVKSGIYDYCGRLRAAHGREVADLKADAESEERWANQYFEEADRLADIVRRAVDFMERKHAVSEADRALLAEARKAIGEEAE